MVLPDLSFEKLHPKLIEALDASTCKDIIRIPGGKLVVSEYDQDTLIDCDREDCFEFASHLVVLITAEPGNELHANLCEDCCKDHIEYSKTRQAFLIYS